MFFKIYGASKIPSRGPIPAHILGNMWAQDWTALFDRVAPYPNLPSFDVTEEMQRQVRKSFSNLVIFLSTNFVRLERCSKVLK